jgi:hypothetical protein
MRKLVVTATFPLQVTRCTGNDDEANRRQDHPPLRGHTLPGSHNRVVTAFGGKNNRLSATQGKFDCLATSAEELLSRTDRTIPATTRCKATPQAGRFETRLSTSRVGWINGTHPPMVQSRKESSQVTAKFSLRNTRATCSTLPKKLEALALSVRFGRQCGLLKNWGITTACMWDA